MEVVLTPTSHKLKKITENVQSISVSTFLSVLVLVEAAYTKSASTKKGCKKVKRVTGSREGFRGGDGRP